MSPEQLDRAERVLCDALALIDGGSFDASADQRAYLSGALDALRLMPHNQE